jgi:hypothetical protein
MIQNDAFGHTETYPKHIIGFAKPCIGNQKHFE